MILIIDDDVPLGTALEKMFRFAGLEAVAIPSGMEALSLLPIRKPKLILLDLDMPLMNGMTILQSIRQDPTFNAIPIVVFTSDFAELSRSRALAAGAQDYLVKGTLGWEALLTRIRSHLTRTEPQLRYMQ